MYGLLCRLPASSHIHEGWCLGLAASWCGLQLSEEILRIGFYDKDEIYIVPVNYGFSYNNEKYIFYFHGAKAGRKYELAKLNPKVGFEIDGKYSLVTGDIACDYTAYYQSVIGNGILSIVENTEEKPAEEKETPADQEFSGGAGVARKAGSAAAAAEAAATTELSSITIGTI